MILSAVIGALGVAATVLTYLWACHREQEALAEESGWTLEVRRMTCGNLTVLGGPDNTYWWMGPTGDEW